MSGFAGFDRDDYPGDDIMAFLLANTNLVWCGYYLAPTPSHRDTSWMGRRDALDTAGWGIAPIYVGQQVVGPGSHDSSTASGVEDGNEAASLMLSEGFALGSSVYLDIENGPPLTQLQVDYLGAWCDAVEAGGYLPAVYCSHSLAQKIHTLEPDCRIWAFKVPTTQAHPASEPFPTPDPSGSGFAGAFMWQRDQNCNIAVISAETPRLDVDLSSAITADPGAPDPPAAPGAALSPSAPEST